MPTGITGPPLGFEDAQDVTASFKKTLGAKPPSGFENAEDVTASLHGPPPVPRPSIDMREVDLGTGQPIGQTQTSLPPLQVGQRFNFEASPQGAERFVSGVGGYPRILSGLRRAIEASQPPTERPVMPPLEPGMETQYGVNVPQPAVPVDVPEALKGLTEAGQGGMEAAQPAIIAGGLVNPLTTGKGLTEAYLASVGAKYGAQKIGLSPEAQDLAATAAPFVLGGPRILRGLLPEGPYDVAEPPENVFRNLLYKANVDMPAEATPEQMHAGYRKAMGTLHPDVNPQDAGEAQALNDAWNTIRGQKAPAASQPAPEPQQAPPTPTSAAPVSVPGAPPPPAGFEGAEDITASMAAPPQNPLGALQTILPRERSASAPIAMPVAAPPVPTGNPIYEMGPAELDQAAKADKAKDDALLAELFGPDGATHYKAVQRTANGSDTQRADAASAELSRMEQTLTPAQEKQLFGIGEAGPTHEDFTEFRRALGNIDGDTPDELGSSMRWAITKIGDLRDPATMTSEQQKAYAQLRHGFEIADQNGWDKNQVLQSALRGASARFEPNDAAFMLRKFIKPTGQAAEPFETRHALPQKGLAQPPPPAGFVDAEEVRPPAPGSPEYETLRAKVAALEAPKTEAKPQAGNAAIANRLRQVADRMDAQIDERRRPMTQNPTPKRMAEYRSRIIDADEMERTQKAMRALADAHEAGTIPPELVALRSKDEIGRLVHKGLDTSKGGYYDRIPRQDYADKSPAGNKLQAMIEGAATPTATAEKAAKEKASQISQLEAQVQFQRLPGYFTTPKPVIDKMLARAGILPGQSVLEPSAGKGDIADAIRERVPNAKVDAVEPQSSLRKILELKGHALAGSDFLEHKVQYDKIVMNPPFEKGADVEHVRHAYELLKPGGRLVAIMSPHAEFASDKKSVEFRDWLDSLGAESEKLPESSFKASGTGVASRMVTIDKPAAPHREVISTAIPSFLRKAQSRAAEEIPPGPGAMNVRANQPEGSPFQIKEVTDALNRLAREKDTPQQQVEAAVEAVPESADPNDTAIAKVKAAGQALWHWYTKGAIDYSDFDKAVRQWDGAKQLAGLEVNNLMKASVKAVPDKLAREAIVNYMEADGGDPAVMRERAKQVPSRFKRGYERAAKLTDKERAVAANYQVLMDHALDLARKEGVLENGVEDYISHVWKSVPGKVEKWLRKVSAELNLSSLRPNPSFTRKRVWQTYFEGEKLGAIPEKKDAAFLVGSHLRSLYNAIADRAFIKGRFQQKASDGRPEMIVGGGMKIPRPEGGAVLIKPQTKTPDTSDYVYINHPAFRRWKWIGEDADERPVFMQGDVFVHPEIADGLKNIFGTSAVRSYHIGPVYPGRIALGLSSGFKNVLLQGIPSFFHETTVRLHGAEHRINPLHVKAIDTSDPETRELIQAGLKVFDGHGMAEASEGLAPGGVLLKLPVLGPWYQAYGERLFQRVIPGLKVSMGKHAFARNLERYPTVPRDTVAMMTADQGNAAFGELNYAALMRNKTMQDFLRMTFLAPDFFEARARFVGQAARPYGREQLVALLLGAGVMYTVGRILNQMLDNDPHWDRPFSLVVHGHEYSLRTIQGDVLHLITDPAQFINVRLHPTTTRTAIEALTGRNEWGQKRDAGDQIADFVERHTPIPGQALWSKRGLSPARKALKSALQTFGINETLYRSAAEREAMKHQEPSRGGASQRPQAALMRDYRRQIQEDKLDRAQLNRDVRAGKLTAKDGAQLLRETHTTRLASDLTSMPLKDALEVFDKMSATEKKANLPLMRRKASAEILRYPPDQRADLRARVQQSLSDREDYSVLPGFLRRFATSSQSGVPAR